MNNNENLTPETTPVEPAATAESAVTPAPTPAPVVAPAAPPMFPKKESARSIFLLPNIFRAIAILCMIVGLAITVFLPVFTVKVEYDDIDGLLDLYSAEEIVSFSLYDLLTDLKGEIDLHNEYLDKVKEIQKDKDYDESAITALKYDYSAPKDAGKFSDGMTTYIINLRLGELDEYTQKLEEYSEKVAKGDTSAKMPAAPQPGQNRFNTFFFHLFIYAVPVLLCVIYAINLLIRIIQTLILFIKPNPYPKKADAASTTMLLIGLGGAMAALHYPANGFVLDLYALIPLAVVMAVGIVFDILYRTVTKSIAKKKLDL